MAGAYSAPPCPIRPPTKRPFPILACSLTTPRPRKLKIRKNYLRLKTLNPKPQIEPILTPPETPIQHTHILPSDQFDELEVPENQELQLPENQELQLSERGGAVNANAGTFSKNSLLKYGLWVVGAFVFQTIFAVWILASADYSGKNRSLDQNGDKDEVLVLDSKGKSKYKMRMSVNGDEKQSIGNGGVAFVDEAEMEKKIEEIQQMAREAREKERLHSKGSDFDEESDDEIEDNVKIGIKKEVDERIIKIRKRPENKVSNKQPTNSFTYPKVDIKKNDGDDGGNSDEKNLNDTLLFKRKLKFKDSTSKPSNKPKGFMAPVKKNTLEKRGRKKKGVASDLEESEPGIDTSVDRNDGSSLFEAVDSKESSILKTATIPNTGKTLVEVVDPKESCIMKSTTAMNRSKQSNKNGPSTMKAVKDKKVVKPNGGTKSGNDTDFWWFSLPYVLVIRMRRGHDDEGAEGLFSLKSSSQVNGGLSHTVAFEDPGDATNFCYVLQSFFEDLGDFEAEIVPLPVKELSKAIRLHTMKVIVVKKGILKFYAGQPLVDAEMALRSLVEQQ